jgi:hypothetical protein
VATVEPHRTPRRTGLVGSVVIAFDNLTSEETHKLGSSVALTLDAELLLLKISIAAISRLLCVITACSAHSRSSKSKETG